jgi:hypothetical protein
LSFYLEICMKGLRKIGRKSVGTIAFLFDIRTDIPSLIQVSLLGTTVVYGTILKLEAGSASVLGPVIEVSMV